MRVLGLALMLVVPLHAAVIGVSVPAPSLTAERVRAELPPDQQKLWLDYLQRSAAQMRADKAALAKERVGMAVLPPAPQDASSARAIPLLKDTSFYRSSEAVRLADAILSFQTPAGGWSKNLAFDAPRAKGQSYTANNLSKFLGPDDFDAPKDPNWNYVGTLDNDATNTELKYLALMSAAWPGHAGDKYRAGYLRGIRYLLHAQYPNGGWPQVWPLEGGYHDAITFNDDAVTESAETLLAAASGERREIKMPPTPESVAAARQARSKGPQIVPPAPFAGLPRTYTDYRFVPQSLRQSARAAADRALQCILHTQVKVDGVLTVWAQQYDPLTLQPVSGRNFEPAALSSGESASVLQYLLGLARPTPQVQAAIAAAGKWFQATRIMGYTWTGGRQTPGGRTLTAVPGAGPLWARYYSLTTGKPVFGDRDKTVHDNVMELSLERRNGYAWYSAAPEAVVQRWALLLRSNEQ